MCLSTMNDQKQEITSIKDNLIVEMKENPKNLNKQKEPAKY